MQSSVAQLLRRAFLWLPPLLYMVTIFHFSSESQPLPTVTAHVWDKILHSVEYAGLGALVFRALVGGGMGWWPAALLTLAIVSGYGATDEWHQLHVPSRIADIRDWLADTVGAAAGASAYWIINTASRPHRPLQR
jgi:VanZ family protein